MKGRKDLNTYISYRAYDLGAEGFLFSIECTGEGFPVVEDGRYCRTALEACPLIHPKVGFHAYDAHGDFFHEPFRADKLSFLRSWVAQLVPR